MSAIPINATTRVLIAELDSHQAARPTGDADYLVHIDHLRIEMDTWARHDAALRLVLGEKLVAEALGAWAAGELR